MITYHIDNWLTRTVRESDRFGLLNDEQHVNLYNEIKNALLQNIVPDIQKLIESKSKINNDNNSYLIWTLGLTDTFPSNPISIKSFGSYPD